MSEPHLIQIDPPEMPAAVYRSGQAEPHVFLATRIGSQPRMPLSELSKYDSWLRASCKGSWVVFTRDEPWSASDPFSAQLVFGFEKEADAALALTFFGK